MSKLKIVHILNSVGGVDVSLRLILENINSLHFENIVIHGKNDTEEPYINSNGDLIEEYKLPIERNINLLKDLTALYQTVILLKKIKPNLIHAHSAKGGVIANFITKFLKIPVLHTPQAYSYLSAKNEIKKKIYLQIERLLVNKKNKILASSHSEMQRAVCEVGYTKKNVLLFNNSIKPIKKFKPLTVKKNWPDEYICSVGRPSYQKDIELLIDVLWELKQNNKNIYLVLMGVGYHSPNLKAIKERIAKLSLKNNITLLKWTSREDIFNIIKDSRLYISTARYEGLPYSIIESLALSKPIVATKVDGNQDLVINEYNGLLISERNPKEIARATERILNSKDLQLKFSKNAKKTFHDNYNINETIFKLEKIYQNEAMTS